jgi:hypothetical protein
MTIESRIRNPQADLSKVTGRVSFLAPALIHL